MADIFRDDIINLPDAILNIGGTITTVSGVTTITGGTNVTINRFALEFHIVDSETQKIVLLNNRGAARLVWPDVLPNLPAAQRNRVIRRAIEEIVVIRLEALG